MGLGTTVDVPGLRALVGSILGVENGPQSAMTSGALSVRVSPIDHPISMETYSALLAGPATAIVSMGVENKGEEAAYHEAKGTMLVTAARLAVQADAEACMTFQLDKALMRRRSGELCVYDWYTDWLDPES